MTFKTPLIQTKNGNKLDTEAWRKTLDFAPPPKTRDQIAADAAAHALVKDTRDNRDPVKYGEALCEARGQFPEEKLTDVIDSLDYHEVRGEFLIG